MLAYSVAVVIHPNDAWAASTHKCKLFRFLFVYPCSRVLICPLMELCSMSKSYFLFFVVSLLLIMQNKFLNSEQITGSKMKLRQNEQVKF